MVVDLSHCKSDICYTPLKIRLEDMTHGKFTESKEQ